MVIVFVVIGLTYTGFSFAASSNNTQSQSITPSIATNSVAQNPTLTSGPGCSATDNFLWNHVYNVNNGQPWGEKPGRLLIIPDSQYTYGSCVTVTGKVYSAVSTGGTHDEPDGDLHFTLTLLDHPEYSNSNDPKCISSHDLPNPCHNIIVEVICHKTPPASSYLGHGDYCKN